ncbi:MAG: hypothetical protein QOH95_1331, partial [Gaiellaceae bacterium]|nr:hypothetical protein [Gaiellaceae bacterium]
MTPWPPWACPEHVVDLQEEGDALACPEGERYGVVDGVPRFVPGRRYSDAF